MNTRHAFQPLVGLYEPSAILQLPDGRFLVVEDEVEHPFSLLEIDPDGKTTTTPLERGWLDFDSGFWKLDDLEGLACDPSGRVYAVTSHSRTGEGQEKRARDKLVRFRVEGDRVVEREVADGLKAALTTAHTVLAEAAKVRDVKGAGGLNIEALEWAADGDALLVGFRSPLLEGRAVIARVRRPDVLFEGGPPPRIDLLTLDLDGNGLRGLAWVPALAGYLAIAGPVAREQVPFRVWFWDGQSGASARRVTVLGLDGFEHAEGICPARIGGRDCLVLVSDDGSRAEGRYARYLVLAIDQLHIGA
ncbi:MAG: DUF3616 domain-containing protein [Thiobacillus sp.]|nr:DUF3616 domain-containing protein [Thiobacillus sp.]